MRGLYTEGGCIFNKPKKFVICTFTESRAFNLVSLVNASENGTH